MYTLRAVLQPAHALRAPTNQISTVRLDPGSEPTTLTCPEWASVLISLLSMSLSGFDTFITVQHIMKTQLSHETGRPTVRIYAGNILLF